MKIYPSENFREIRLKKGFTITSLAAEIGISKQAMGMFEREENGVNPDTAQRIIEALGTDFDELFVFVERKKPQEIQA